MPVTDRAAETAALREVAAVMRDCAADLPDESIIGQELWSTSCRLQGAADRLDRHRRLRLVDGGLARPSCP